MRRLDTKNKIRKISHAYYEKHKDKINLRKKAYYKTHKKQSLAQRKRYYNDNKEAVLKQCAGYRKMNPDKRLNSSLKYHYGITLDDKKRMLHAQDGKCAVCKLPFKSNRDTCVDHNHVTDSVRELLCQKCNSAIGLMNDTPERLEAAAAYIRKWNK